MGKKKRSSQNSNNAICQRDSSESESPNDSSQITEANKVNCSKHINRSADINALRKNFKSNKNAYVVCSSCKKNEESNICKDGWVCLQCGSYNCGPNEADHRTDHYKKPHSDSHYLAFQLSSNTIWCFKCEQEVPVDVNKKVQSCIDMIKKQHNDNLLIKPVQRDTDSRKMNDNNAPDYLKSGISSCRPLENSLQNKGIKSDLNLPKVRGLCNLGNTCFFNSVLQCLAQTHKLVSLLEEMDVRGEKFHLELEGTTIDAELEKHKSSEVSEQLARVLTEVAGGGGDGDAKAIYNTVNPRLLLKALTNKCPQFEGGDQHDAHELLRHLLDSVYKEDLKRYQAAILNHIGFYDEAKKNLDDLDEEKKKFGKKLNQKVCDTILIRPDHLFKGSLVSILQCEECHHKSKREETFLDLSLPVAHGRALPPSVRRKQNNNVDEFSSIEEKDTTEETPTMSKHQLNKQKRIEKRAFKNQMIAQKKEESKGEPTIEEEKKDSIDGEQTDADVEDNEDNACEDQYPKKEIVESGYSSEKQMSARGSPVTTQSTEDQNYDLDKPTISDRSVYSTILGLPGDAGTQFGNTAESGLGSNQELTVAIPEENNPDCTSQESVLVNPSNGSLDISSDSQQGNFRNVDLSSEYQLPLGSDSNSFRRERVLDWNCVGSLNEPQSQSQDRSVSPGCSRDINVSPKDSDPFSGSQSNEMSVCTSLPNSNDNMSICDSLPENVSLLLNSPNKKDENNGLEEKLNVVQQQQENGIKMFSPDDLLELDSTNSPKEENSGTEEIINLGVKNNTNKIEETKRCSPVDIGERVNLEFPREENSGPEEVINLKENQKSGCRQISRCSPVEPGELTELDSGLLKLSLEGMTCAGDAERRSSPVTTSEVSQPVYNDQGQTGFVLVGGVKKSSIPLPPPSPPTALFTAPYKFIHPEPAVPRCDSIYQRPKIKEGECSLQSCLNQFTTIEMLSGGNKVGCEACTERFNKGNKEGKTVYQNSSKQLLICKLPPIMIFHLKRFQVLRLSSQKISGHVVFPLVLDISPFCSFDEPNITKPSLYSLYGVVEHSGTMHGGHYVAYVKVRSPTNNSPGVPPPGKWYHISDSRVSSIEESDVLTKQAYLLFYEKL